MPATLQSLLHISQELIGNIGMRHSTMPPIADGSASFEPQLLLPSRTAWRQQIPVKDPCHREQLFRIDDFLQSRREECRRQCLRQYAQTARALRNDESLTQLSDVAMFTQLGSALESLFLDIMSRLDKRAVEWQEEEWSRNRGDDTSFPEVSPRCAHNV